MWFNAHIALCRRALIDLSIPVPSEMWDFYVLIMCQSHVLLLWQQQCPLSTHHAQYDLCGSFSYGHMKWQMKPIPVSVTALVMRRYHCHGNRNIEICLLWCVYVWLYPTTASNTIGWLTLEPEFWPQHYRITSHWKNWSELQTECLAIRKSECWTLCYWLCLFGVGRHTVM